MNNIINIISIEYPPSLSLLISPYQPGVKLKSSWTHFYDI